MSSAKKHILFLYIITNGLTNCIVTVLIISLSTSLFQQDASGVTSAYLEPPILLGVACMGILGGYFLKFFSITTIGIGAPLIIGNILLTLAFINNPTPIIGYGTLFLFTFFGTLEHANGLNMMNTLLDNQTKPFFLYALYCY